MKSGDTENDPVFKRPKELNEKERLIQNHQEHITRLYLASSAIEKTPDKSNFTKKLFKALDEGGHRDGLLTAGEIFELYLKSVRPTPIFGEFGKDEAGSNYLFFPEEAKEVIAISKAEKEKVDAYQSEIEVWEAARKDNTIPAYERYLQKFPEGVFVTAAKAEMDRLGAEYILSGNRLFDKRDGQTYKTIMIEGKMWMAQNLNINVEGSYCYKDKEVNCEKYGRLYTWEVAKEACPKGWHLPSDEEWREMAKYYGGARDDASDGGKAAYDALIDGGRSGFAALLGGICFSSGSYSNLGTYGYYWTSTESSSSGAWYYNFVDGKLWRFNYYRSYGLSVRCLQD